MGVHGTMYLSSATLGGITPPLDQYDGYIYYNQVPNAPVQPGQKVRVSIPNRDGYNDHQTAQVQALIYAGDAIFPDAPYILLDLEDAVRVLARMPQYDGMLADEVVASLADILEG